MVAVMTGDFGQESGPAPAVDCGSMKALYDTAGHVSRGLAQLADELRTADLPDLAGRCDDMSQALHRAVHDALAETQPIDPPIRKGP